MLEGTIRNVFHEDIKYKSYVIRIGHFISEKVDCNCILRCNKLLNKEKDVIWLSSDEKIFSQDQKKMTNDNADPLEVQGVQPNFLQRLWFWGLSAMKDM